MSLPRRLGFWLVFTLPFGCFAEPAAPCPAGSQGCPCADLQCEADLVCTAGVCMAPSMASTGAVSAPSSPSPVTAASTSAASAGSSSGSTTSTSQSLDDTSTSDTGSSASSSESTGEPLCGNGILDADEMCDGTNGCTDECELENFPCNPFNNVGCQPNQKCSFLEPATILCLGFSDEVGDFGANDCFRGGAPHDEDCAIGLACIPFQITNTCDGGGCCEEYCDLGDPDFECTTPGNTCQPAYGSPPFETGLEWLGFCARDF